MHVCGQACGTHRVTANAVFRADPTRTTALRRMFEADLERRFNVIKKLITTVVEKENAFDIHAVMVVNEGRFGFTRTADKRRAFMRWLKDMERQEILEISEGTPVSKAADSAWTNKYIQSAYQKGIANAGGRLRKAGADVSDRWLQAAFNRPIHLDRIGRIFTRTFSELNGITKEMDKRISRTLALGLAEGRSPRDMARALRKEVDVIGITRARTLARTEVVAAHSEANLSAFEEAGIEGVEVEAELSTSGDPCPLCAALEGNTYTIREARNLIPVHPNCRCAWTPKIVNGSGIVLR